jgi:hypothetical protein
LWIAGGVACSSGPKAPPAAPPPPPAAPVAKVSWRGMELPVHGNVRTSREDTIEIDGGGEALPELEAHYVAALAGHGWSATQHTPARDGEQPGILDDIMKSMPVDYIGVTLDKAGEQIEMSIMRDEEGTAVILLYLGKSAG